MLQRGMYAHCIEQKYVFTLNAKQNNWWSEFGFRVTCQIDKDLRWWSKRQNEFCYACFCMLIT